MGTVNDTNQVATECMLLSQEQRDHSSPSPYEEEQASAEKGTGSSPVTVDGACQKHETCYEDDIEISSEIEDGEILDKDDSEKGDFGKPICRFYQQGTCAWGKSCRFLHVSPDKGLYTMIESHEIILPPPPPLLLPVCECHFTCREHTPDVLQTAWDQALKKAQQRVNKWDILTKHESSDHCTTKDLRLTLEKKREEKKRSNSPLFQKAHKSATKKSPLPHCDASPINNRKKHRNHFDAGIVLRPKSKKDQTRNRSASFWHDPWKRSRSPNLKQKRSRSSLDCSSNSDECNLKRSRSCSRERRRPNNRYNKSYQHSKRLREVDHRNRSCSPRRYSHRTRSYRSVSCSSRSSSPGLSVSRKVSIRVDTKLQSKRDDRRFYCFVRRRRNDHSVGKPSRTLQQRKKRSVTSSPVCSRRGKNPLKDVTVAKRYNPMRMLKHAQHWTPKKIRRSPAVEDIRSCSDMSISPLSDSSLSELFEPTKKLCLQDDTIEQKHEDFLITKKAKPPATKKLYPVKNDSGSQRDIDASSLKKKSSPAEVYGPVFCPEKMMSDTVLKWSNSSSNLLTWKSNNQDHMNGNSVREEGRFEKSDAGKETNIGNSSRCAKKGCSNPGRKMADDKKEVVVSHPLENDLMKFHQRPSEIRSSVKTGCVGSNNKITTANSLKVKSNGSAKKVESNNTNPSKKELLLKRLEEIDAAIKEIKRRNHRL